MLSRRGFLGVSAAGAMALGGHLVAATGSRRVAFVGDTKHYFEIEHPRVLAALGEGFSEAYGVTLERYPVDYENPSALHVVAENLRGNPPNFLAGVGDVEAEFIRAAMPNVPMVFNVNHDSSMLGLTTSISEPSSLATGHCGDQLEHVMPLYILREMVGRRPVTSIVIAATPAWLSPPRMVIWHRAAQELGIVLHHVDATSYDGLRNSVEWRSAGDFDAWILPLSHPTVTQKKAVVDHLNASGTLGFFERFTATRIGAPLAYASTLQYWHHYFAQALRLLVSGVSAAQIPVRNASVWRYSANAGAIKSLGMELPETVVSRIHEIF